uniref:Uncharacterized protein n=1 Tax=Caenorhabditis japonica TaxID=281687 RepID=A0A8R1E9B5_CAEJA
MLEIQWLTAQQNPLDVQESLMIEISDLSLDEFPTLVFLEFVTCKMNSMDYQDTLQKGIIFFFNRGNRKKTNIFQKDNAAIHKSSSTINWFSTKKIKDLA